MSSYIRPPRESNRTHIGKGGYTKTSSNPWHNKQIPGSLCPSSCLADLVQTYGLYHNMFAFCLVNSCVPTAAVIFYVLAYTLPAFFLLIASPSLFSSLFLSVGVKVGRGFCCFPVMRVVIGREYLGPLLPWSISIIPRGSLEGLCKTGDSKRHICCC